MFSGCKGRDVLSVGAFQDIFDPVSADIVFGFNGYKNSALADGIFIQLGFVLGDAETDQCADQPARCSARSQTRKSAD